MHPSSLQRGSMMILVDESSAPASAYALLCAGLETMGTPALLLDEHAQIVYATGAAAHLLGRDGASLIGQAWPAFWAAASMGDRAVTEEPQRLALPRADGVIPVRVW